MVDPCVVTAAAEVFMSFVNDGPTASEKGTSCCEKHLLLHLRFSGATEASCSSWADSNDIGHVAVNDLRTAVISKPSRYYFIDRPLRCDCSQSD